ncbi:MAG: PIN domain-containing protein [Oscillospiraceae bacterium]|nr:PIN domain-containing protein [Oscillospiraceae bacterium]
MKLLIDTNVILDYLLNREPFFENSARIALLSEKGYTQSYISACAVTDIFYIAKKELKSHDVAIELIKKMLSTIRIASITEIDIYEAIDLKWSDFEDSVQYVAGKSVSVEYIITRNPKDFSESKIKVISPEEFLDLIIS